MSVAEIKQTKLNLIAWIEQLSDIGMLEFLDTLKESKLESDWWETMSESQKQHLNEGLKDLEAGRTMSSKKFLVKAKK